MTEKKLGDLLIKNYKSSLDTAKKLQSVYSVVMKNLIIFVGIAMIVIAIWQCDATPRGDHHRRDRGESRRNGTEFVQVVVKSKEGKFIVANIPAWKLKNKTKEQLTVTTDEDGHSFINVNGELKEVQINKKFKGKKNFGFACK